MKYFYVREQGGGCDYTIGCGISVEEIRAKSLDEAIEKVVGLPEDWKEYCEEDDYFCDSGIYEISSRAEERKIKYARLFEVNKVVDMIPILQKHLNEVEAYRAELKIKNAADAELKQYEKLKKKFEGK
jgi:hypothetical protein